MASTTSSYTLLMSITNQPTSPEDLLVQKSPQLSSPTQSSTSSNHTNNSTANNSLNRRERRSSIDSTDSNLSEYSIISAKSTSTPELKSSVSPPPRPKKSVHFYEVVLAAYTYGPWEYDRTTIDVSPLTRDEIIEIMRLRREAARLQSYSNSTVKQSQCPSRASSYYYSYQ